MEPFEKQKDPVDTFQTTINVNLMQSVYLTKYSLSHLKKTHGIIVPVSSVAGLIGSWGSSAYSASKHAIHGFFKSLRMEVGNSVSISIMPLPYVSTDTAINNLQYKYREKEMTPEDCAQKMLSIIPIRSRLALITWDTWFVVKLSIISDQLVEFLAYNFIKENGEVIKQFEQSK